MAKLLWTLKQHVGPQPRVGHGMAYDSQAGGTLLFGGQFFQPARLGDTWQWDGENWTQLDDIGPPPRSELAMAYDPGRQRTVLFGGSTDGTALLDDRWEWNGEDWSQVADSGPAARSGHAMVFDSVRNCTLLFGGEAGGTPLGDTWQWDGNEWVQVEDTGPGLRQAAAMAFDTVRGRAVLFGGTDGAQVFGDTWEWDGTSWTQTSTFGPPPCLGATMVYTGQSALLYGGASQLTFSAVLFANSWEWDGKHWTIRQDMGPGPRWSHGMVFDTARNRGVLFGGTADPPLSPPTDPATALGDTWEQFEQGVTVGPAGPSAIVQSITATDGAIEGEPIDIGVTLSGTPSAGSTVSLSLTDANGVTLLTQEFEADELLINPMFLSQGTYIASATLGGSSKNATFQVMALQPPTPVLMSLTANPTSVQSGSPFTLTAGISRATEAADITIPLRLAIGGVPKVPQIWLGEQLTITAGATSGEVEIGETLGPGIYTWTATYGGATDFTATVQVT